MRKLPHEKSIATAGPGGALGLARDILLKPGRALERVRGPGAALREAGRIYAAALAAAVLFYAYKPEDFPKIIEGAAAVRYSGGLLFWSQAFAWTVLHNAVLVALIAYFGRLLKEGWLPLRLALGVLHVAAPLLLLLSYLGSKTLSSGPILLAWALIVACMRPNFLKVEPGLWRPLASWVLAGNAIPLAGLPLTLLATHGRWHYGYYGLEIAKSLWLLGLTAFGAARLCALPAARAIAAVVLSMLFSILLFVSLWTLNLLPKSSIIVLFAV